MISGLIFGEAREAYGLGLLWVSTFRLSLLSLLCIRDRDSA
jgi:hypothetical protein